MKPLVQPQVNLNGTARKELVEQQLKVWDAMHALTEAMAQAMPHGRDYQFRPAEYAPAREAWLERMLAVHAMQKEIADHAAAIQQEN
jgi:hypothetical protein